MGEPTTTRCGGFRHWVRSPACLLYTNFALSSWGDRLWHFAVGLYLVYLDGGSLRLAAIYGFTVGVAILLLGGPIGHWVDSTGRMKVVRLSLFLQNTLVMLSALSVYFILDHHAKLEGKWTGSLRYLCETVIVILSLIAQLASVAYKVAIEKDWIVVVASGNKTLLANLNAVTRAIDLTCKVIAPTVAGQIMTYGSLKMAALFIAGWNLVSVFVEYALLRRVYQLVPRLAVKTPIEDQLEDDAKEMELKELSPKKSPNPKDHSKNSNSPCAIHHSDISLDGDISQSGKSKSPQDLKEEEVNLQSEEQKNEDSSQVVPQKTTTQLIFGPFLRLFNGWGIYIRQRVVYAGLALALLYMTVLGFDSITVGYIYSQGISESILGICTAVAGVTGIFGTFLFTKLRKKLGLERTGLIAFNAEIACLLFCVASVWAPGSPFNPHYKLHSQVPSNCSSPNLLFVNGSDAMEAAVPYVVDTNSTGLARTVRDVSHPFSAQNMLSQQFLFRMKRDQLSNLTVSLDQGPVSSGLGNSSSPNGLKTATTSASTVVDCEAAPKSKISISLFLVGILTSRVGLWMSDLVVTQLLQENVPEKQRGVVGGVQHSLNMLIDTLKFTMVIIAPHIETFGILILLSFAFICLGGCSFAFHASRTFKMEKELASNNENAITNGEA